MNSNIEIINGDSFDVLRRFRKEGRRFDCVCADPPYCSGGARFAEKKGGAEKYVDTARRGGKFENSFADGMEQTAFIFYLRELLTRAVSLLNPPGYVFLFTDWRQYGATATALQGAGLTWRGVVVWNKGNARANPGYFAPLCEFVLWGTKEGTSGKFAPGFFQFPAPQAAKRIHPTEKPPEIFEHLLKILPDGAAAFDPYCGSAACGVAALRLGLDYCGVEIVPEFATAARARLDDEFKRLAFLDKEQEPARQTKFLEES